MIPRPFLLAPGRGLVDGRRDTCRVSAPKVIADISLEVVHAARNGRPGVTLPIPGSSFLGDPLATSAIAPEVAALVNLLDDAEGP